MKADTKTTSSSEPNARAMAAPVMEAPVMETPATEIPVAQTPVVEAPVTETPACSHTPAPMETGGVGDGQSWAKCIETGMEEEFQQDRPTKCCRSQCRKHEQRQTLPFPLQDSEGRLTAISQLYEHVGEHPAARHNVAGRGIMHLYLEVLPSKATCLGNQVICMTPEYHLTGSA